VINRLDVGPDVAFHAPGYVAVVERGVAEEFARNPLDPRWGGIGEDLVHHAEEAEERWRELHTLPFAPTCLTLYLNGDCNLRCTYCFSEPARHGGARLAGEAVTAAARLVAANCAAREEPVTVALHGGGEPTLDADLLEDLLGRVEVAAAERDLPAFRYVATNGVMSEARAAWLARRVDLVGLSCDGPPDLHDAQRPTWAGHPTSSAVERTARVLREAGTPFHVRVTVTAESCARQAEIAEHLCGLGAAEIHAEPVYRVGRAAAGAADAPPFDPAAFVDHFLAAQEAAHRHGVAYLTSGSRIDEVHGSHCHVLRQVLQLVPGDVATSCFAVSDAAAARRTGTLIGGWDGESFTVDDAAVRRQQERLAVWPAACESCVARLHCAGTCPEGCVLAGRTPPDSVRCEVNRLLAVAQIRAAAQRLRRGSTAAVTGGAPGRCLTAVERTGRP
jgi:uncharacterized protein